MKMIRRKTLMIALAMLSVLICASLIFAMQYTVSNGTYTQEATKNVMTDYDMI